MLIALNIKNFALIHQLNVEFGPGFNILSGETGAGKSILIDSIDYVLGGKFSKDLIRYGEDKTYVEAIFTVPNSDVIDILDELNIDRDEILIISRESTMSGKNLVKINGKTIVLSQLKRIREKLIDVHGQHQNQNLLNKSNHITYLDEFCYEKIGSYLEKFTSLKYKFNEIKNKLSDLIGNEDREKILNYIKFQIEDIESAKLKQGEEELLASQYNVLANAEKISLGVSKSYEYLASSDNGNSALESISKALNELTNIEKHLDKIREKKCQIEEAYYLIEDATREIRDISNDIYFDDNELATINERLFKISSYKKKYGGTVEKILENLHDLKVQHEELINSDELIEKLRDDLSSVNSEMKEIGLKLYEIRKLAAIDLETRIKQELCYVGLGKAEIKINIIHSEYFNGKGYDEVQFLVSANPGEPLKPLEKVLSGGELSRIMLAIKCVFVDKDKIPTLIFDEIDTGISGAIGRRVGEKMYEVSKGHQVLCITHLPQIAAMSDNHYFISKVVEEEKTFTNIKVLSMDEKIREIAIMIAGEDITEVSLKNALEMIEVSERKKYEIKS